MAPGPEIAVQLVGRGTGAVGPLRCASSSAFVLRGTNAPAKGVQSLGAYGILIGESDTRSALDVFKHGNVSSCRRKLERVITW